MFEIEAKTILQTSKPTDMWFHTDYNMNLYKGCSHGCIYCDSRSENYKVENFDLVRSKKNAIEILEKELQKKKKGIIGLGAMSDPYNPVEKTLELTRKALERISKYGFGISIATKSTLILRDIDLLQEIAKRNVVHVAITITTADDTLQKVLEPNVSSSSERFEAIRRLKEAGLFAGVLMMPILPYINDTSENVTALVRQAKNAMADYIYPFFGMTLRNIQRDYYFTKLDQYFPGLKQKYIERYKEQYICVSDNNKTLSFLFEKMMQESMMLYKIKEINQAILKTRPFEQLMLDV